MAYPRKQTVIIFVICFLAVGGAAAYSFSSQQSQVRQTVPEVTSGGEDQLPDNALATTSTAWQKQFFTDKTGGSYTAATSTTNQGSSQTELTATDVLGRDFFTNYMQLRSAGLTQDQQSVDTMAQNLIARDVTAAASPHIYSIVDIKTDSNQDVTMAAATYATKLMQILQAYMPKQNEAEIAMSALDSNDPEALKAIDQNILGYQAAISALLATPVPSAMIQYHIDLINGLSIELFNSEALRKVTVDPVKAIAAVSLEAQGLQTLSMALGNIQVYLASVGVIFKTPTSGSILQSN